MSHDSISDIGIVTKIEGDAAHVQILTHDSCETCGAKVICKPNKDGNKILVAENRTLAKIGDRVTVIETGSIILKMSLLQYGIPFLGFISGIITAITFEFSIFNLPKEVIQFGCGLIGILVGGLIARRIAHRLAKNSRYFFHITH